MYISKQIDQEYPEKFAFGLSCSSMGRVNIMFAIWIIGFYLPTKKRRAWKKMMRAKYHYRVYK